MLNTMQYIAAWYSLFVYLSFFTVFKKQYIRLAQRYKEGIFAIAFLPYLFANGFSLDLDLLKMLGYFVLVIILLRLAEYYQKSKIVFQFLAVLVIWFAIEFDLLPDANGLLFAGVDVPLAALVGLLLLLFAFAIVYPLEKMGLSFEVSFKDIAMALYGVLGFVVVGLPIGLAIGFLKFNYALPDLGNLIVGIVFGYLFVALAEEILFRGVIQNLFYTLFNNEYLALGLSTVIFGLSHINNKTAGFAVPNWGFVLLASIAGLCYGWVYLKTKKLTVAAITHLLVNLIWLVFFKS